jgi:hypothetical protein
VGFVLRDLIRWNVEMGCIGSVGMRSRRWRRRERPRKYAGSATATIHAMIDLSSTKVRAAADARAAPAGLGRAPATV